MSLTDLERIAEEMERDELLAEYQGAFMPKLRPWATRLRAWIADNREFIEASERHAQWLNAEEKKEPEKAIIWEVGRSTSAALIAAYRAREERNAE